MTDESDNHSQRPLAGGDRPESQPSNAAIDTTGNGVVRDELFSVLANRRRRYVLHCLKTSKTPMAVADVADALVHWETDASPPAVQDTQERVYISLYHCHLPKLAEADLISFDIDQKLVDLREDGKDLPLSVVRPSADNHPRDSN